MLFSSEYETAIKLAPLFAFIAFIFFLESVPKMLLAALGDHKGRNGIQLGALLLNVALNLYMIPMFGIAGAIYATIASGTLRLILLSTRFAINFNGDYDKLSSFFSATVRVIVFIFTQRGNSSGNV